MSTFLQLVQDLHREVGAAGVAPSAVTNQFGEAKRLVNWIKKADSIVQTLWVNWKFLWDQFASANVTTVSVATLSAPADLNFWDFDTFKIQGPSEIEASTIQAIEWNEIKGEVLDTSTDYPSRIIVMPDNSLRFEPIPDGAYTITADYFRKPTLLAANSDISDIPETYHDVILGRAMILYANHENAPEIKDQGSEIYGEQLARMENHELPNKEHSRFTSGGSFVVRPE